MKYEKPEITSVGSALEAVQSSVNKGNTFVDGLGPIATAAAYEADE